MKQVALTRLYFESVAVSKGPVIWLAIAAAIHVGFLCLPAQTYIIHGQRIVFPEGEAGIEIELLSADTAPEQPRNEQPASESVSTADVPPPPVTQVAAKEDVAEPVAKPASPKRLSRKRTLVGAQSSPKAGTAVAQPASQIFTKQPPYPPEARDLGIEGSVRLRVRVATDGSPRAVEILRSSGRSDFDNVSLSTVRHEWRFRPARLADGTPVESTIVVAIQFILHA